MRLWQRVCCYPFRIAAATIPAYDREMSGFQRTTQTLWLLATVALVVWHCVAQHPFQNARDAATLLALVSLSIRAVISVWRWADLAWRKLWLWCLNSSVNWKLVVRVAVADPIEDADIDMLVGAIREARPRDRVWRTTSTDFVNVETHSQYTMKIRPLQSGHESYWSLDFGPVHIGFRDANRIVQREFVPLINDVTARIAGAGETHYAIEARFSKINPYAAVLLNELRTKSVDRILLCFTQEGSTVQLTKDSITTSSSTQADAIETMSTVFGLSLRGAMSASNV